MNILTCNVGNMVHDANCLMFERFLGRSNEPHELIQKTSSISRLLHHGDYLVRHRKQCASAFQCRLIYRRTKGGGTNESGRPVCIVCSRSRIYAPQTAINETITPKLQHKQRDENELEATALNLSYLGLLIPRRLCGDLSNRRGIICRRSAGRLILITLGRIGIIGNTDSGLVSHKGAIPFAI